MACDRLAVQSSCGRRRTSSQDNRARPRVVQDSRTIFVGNLPDVRDRAGPGTDPDRPTAADAGLAPKQEPRTRRFLIGRLDGHTETSGSARGRMLLDGGTRGCRPAAGTGRPPLDGLTATSDCIDFIGTSSPPGSSAVKTMTIRNVPADLAEALENEKVRRRSSLNRTALALLREALGLSKPGPDIA